MNNYNDIINLPHHESKKYKRMPTINRAAQFTPFAALTGYEDAIEETGRLTTERKEIPDLRKDGGEYVKRTGTVEKVDSNKRIVVLNGEEINIADITDIDGIIYNL